MVNDKFSEGEMVGLRNFMQIMQRIVSKGVNPSETKVAMALIVLDSVKGCTAKSIPIDNAFLCYKTGIDKTNISKYIKSLHKKGFIVKNDDGYEISEDILSGM